MSVCHEKGPLRVVIRQAAIKGYILLQIFSYEKLVPQKLVPRCRPVFPARPLAASTLFRSTRQAPIGRASVLTCIRHTTAFGYKFPQRDQRNIILTAFCQIAPPGLIITMTASQIVLCHPKGQFPKLPQVLNNFCQPGGDRRNRHPRPAAPSGHSCHLRA